MLDGGAGTSGSTPAMCVIPACGADIGGCKEQIEKMREVVELPMLHPEKFVQLGIDPPKGVLCYGPPGVASPPVSELQLSSDGALSHDALTLHLASPSA